MEQRLISAVSLNCTDIKAINFTEDNNIGKASSQGDSVQGWCWLEQVFDQRQDTSQEAVGIAQRCQTNSVADGTPRHLKGVTSFAIALFPNE